MIDPTIAGVALTEDPTLDPIITGAATIDPTIAGAALMKAHIKRDKTTHTIMSTIKDSNKEND